MGNNPKLWVVRPNVGTVTGNTASTVTCLPCNCPSADCKAIYDAYLEEKAMVKVLQDRLEDYSSERTFIVEQVAKSETEHTSKIKELETCISEQWAKLDGLNKALENERRLRMEDVYKLEFLKQENHRLIIENKETRQNHINAVNALPELENENKLLKQSLLLNKDTIEKMNGELQQYDYELSKLEGANTRLRLRVSQSDDQIDSMRQSSIQSLFTSAKNNLPPIKTLKSASMASHRSNHKLTRGVL